MNIASSIERGGALFPLRPALFSEGTALSYREIDRRASRMANALRGLGVGPGDRVALVLPNSPTWVTFYLGVLKLGAVVVSVNPSFTAGELRAVLADSGARVALVTDEHRADLQSEAPPALEHLLTTEDLDGLLEPASPVAAATEVGRDTPAVIVYTSGTTGVPKGAVLSHGNVQFNMEAKQRYLGIRPDDRLILFLPLFHCFGQNAILNAGLGAGASIVLHPRFSPEPVAASLREDRVTMLFGVPTTYILLAERLTGRAPRPPGLAGPRCRPAGI
jgi:long-chain acyl-CoA synthetase